MPERAVVHLNVAHFAVAVERVVDTRLRQRPVILAPEGTARAVVFDMSQEAFLAGVRKGMPLGRAGRLCRDASLRSPCPERYERAMRRFCEMALPYTPLIEAVDQRGHLFLDLSGTSRLFGPPQDVAWRLRRQMKAELGLEPIWSLAPNKLLAKVATRLVKPSGEYVVQSGEEAEVLRPLPLPLLPGLEAPELRLLRELNLARVGQVARLSLAQLQVAVGSTASSLHETARGIDRSPVLPAGRRPPAVRRELTLASDANDAALVEGALYSLVEQAGQTLRRRGLVARRVGLTLDYTDGSRLTRAASCRTGTAGDQRLFALALAALRRAWVRRVRLRHLRLTCDRLCPPPAQLELFPTPESADQRRDRALSGAMDDVRGRFGDGALRVGRTLAVERAGQDAA